MITQYCGTELIWGFDPSYIAKSGKKTPGIGYFWSGCAGSMKWGLELSAIALADIENHTAMHYHAVQTQAIKGEESLRSYYVKILCKQAPELLKTSNTMAFDAFFSKKPFVDSIYAVGFTMISRWQSNIYMRYAYVGDQKAKGRKKRIRW